MVVRMTGTMRLRSEKPKLKKSPATRGKMQAISDVHIVWKRRNGAGSTKAYIVGASQ